MTRQLSATVYVLALVLGLWLMTPVLSSAEDALSLEVLRKVKAATVYLEIAKTNTTTAQGSGFLTDEPGIIVTNAHVVGMADPRNPPPPKIVATVNSGETDSRTLPAQLLFVDRKSDLAVLRIEGTDLPAPLTVVSAKDLTETAKVFIFGFPFGKRLGKNITVSRSSVSSLRKEDGVLKQIQVNGGMHPGNSGGPVVNSKGEVVGMAVSGIAGTSVNFAIPGQHVLDFLHGKIVGHYAEIPWKDGPSIKMLYHLVTVDPLKRIKNVDIEIWPAARDPKRAHGPNHMLPGDGEHTTIAVNYKRRSDTEIELTLAPPEMGKVYYLLPSYDNGSGTRQWRPAFAPNLGNPLDRKELTLKYQPRLATDQFVELIFEGSFKIREGEDIQSVAMSTRSLTNESIPSSRVRERLSLLSRFREYGFSITENEKPIRDEGLDRSRIDLGKMTITLEMDTDGGVAESKRDLSRISAETKPTLVTVNEQVTQGLELATVSLPRGTIKPLQTWTVHRPVLLGVPVLKRSVPTQAEIRYTYLGTRMLDKRETALLGVKGELKAPPGSRRNVGGTVTGLLYAALDTGEILFGGLDFKAEDDLERRDGSKAMVTGTLQITVKRDVPAPSVRPKPKE
jgi:Trypsin-like peptidase domain